MKKDFRRDLYDWNGGDSRMLEAACPTGVEVTDDGSLLCTIPLNLMGTAESSGRCIRVRIQAFGDYGTRLQATTGEAYPAALASSPMLVAKPDWSALCMEEIEGGGFKAYDDNGTLRVKLDSPSAPDDPWSDLLPPTPPKFEMTLYPDGQVPVRLAAHDHFFAGQVDAMALGICEDKNRQPVTIGGAFAAAPYECFCGTGERFARMNLSGTSLNLLNEDGLGVNSHRCYKNVPFILSSRGYGTFFHTSREVRLSLADHSTRSWQFAVPDDHLDVFILGGGTPDRILHHYRALTGFPQDVPRWSYGIWMSRMTYFSAEEVEEIAHRLREEEWPCDVLHLDTGWFAKDWVCEWEFGERFPDPEGFFRRLLDRGFRASLWQNPNILAECRWRNELQAQGLLGKPRETGEEEGSRSDFSSREIVGQLDFSNPRAVEWYQAKIRRLLEAGAVAIKTDFGEVIDMEAVYAGMDSRDLRNLYSLLYQKAASELTREVHGHGLVWARAGWAGCQRYPVHWGGDCACSWDGLAGSLRGGLHLGLSGFAFWSHDVPGFHGIPEFMNSRPDPLLYLRWTQFGTFTSHFRYHGTSEREPWFYPEVAPAVKAWWRLRYSLIPYIERESTGLLHSGRPFLAAMCFEDPTDPVVWHIDDQFMAGRDILVAPVMRESGFRHVYLPDGEWVDFWTGERHAGPAWLRDIEHPPETCPVYLREGAAVPVYPKAVSCVDEMETGQTVNLSIDQSYAGVFETFLAPLLDGLKGT